jgi:hypothetical protein
MNNNIIDTSSSNLNLGIYKKYNTYISEINSGTYKVYSSIAYPKSVVLKSSRKNVIVKVDASRLKRQVSNYAYNKKELR